MNLFLHNSYHFQTESINQWIEISTKTIRLIVCQYFIWLAVEPLKRIVCLILKAILSSDGLSCHPIWVLYWMLYSFGFCVVSVLWYSFLTFCVFARNSPASERVSIRLMPYLIHLYLVNGNLEIWLSLVTRFFGVRSQRLISRHS